MLRPLFEQLPPPKTRKTGWPFKVAAEHNFREQGQKSRLPKISIVTPSYNQSKYLEETIRSVILQGYPNIEYIVIDGRSEDESIDIIRKYEKWITYWVSEKDKGQADAINKGFLRSNGSIMGWLNSDDCLKPGALYRVAKQFIRKPSTNIVCGFREQIDLKTNDVVYKAHLKPDIYTLSRSCYINQETVFWTRKAWETVGKLDDSLDYAIDYDLWQRMLVNGFNFELIPCVQGIFKVHSESKGLRLNEVREKELRLIYRKYLQSTKSEIELRDEIHPAWWKTRDIMLGLGNRGYLNNPIIGRLIVLILTGYVKYREMLPN